MNETDLSLEAIDTDEKKKEISEKELKSILKLIESDDKKDDKKQYETLANNISSEIFENWDYGFPIFKDEKIIDDIITKLANWTYTQDDAKLFQLYENIKTVERNKRNKKKFNKNKETNSLETFTSELLLYPEINWDVNLWEIFKEQVARLKNWNSITWTVNKQSTKSSKNLIFKYNAEDMKEIWEWANKLEKWDAFDENTILNKDFRKSYWQNITLNFDEQPILYYICLAELQNNYPERNIQKDLLWKTPDEQKAIIKKFYNFYIDQKKSWDYFVWVKVQNWSEDYFDMRNQYQKLRKNIVWWDTEEVNLLEIEIENQHNLNKTDNSTKYWKIFRGFLLKA